MPTLYKLPFLHRALTLLGVFLCGFFSAFSQTYNFQKYNVDNGLPQSYVQTILQDKSGYMWLGTSDGLSKFDGITFKTYKKKDGLADNNIFSSYQDKQGNIWFGHASGDISIYYPDSDTFKVLDPGIFNNKSPVYTMFCDKSDRLWLGTLGNGVLLYDVKNAQKISLNDSVPNKLIFGITEDNNGNTWFGTFNGVYVYNKKSFIHIKGLPESAIVSLTRDATGNIWVGSQKNGVIVLPQKHLGKMMSGNFSKENIKEYAQFINIPHLKKGNYPQCIYEDSKGAIWLGTTLGGVLKYIPSGSLSFDGYFKSYSTKNGLSYDHVWTITEDREKSMWFGTLGGGASQLRRNDERFELYDTDDGLVNNNIWSIIQDSKGDFWFGSDGGLTNAIAVNGSLQKFSNYTVKEGLNSDYIQAAYEDAQKNIWTSYRDLAGVCKLELKSKKISCLNKSNGIGDISSIVEDKMNNLWFGSSNTGVIKYNPVTKETVLFNKNNGLKSNKIYCLYKDRKDAIWVATSEGGLSMIKGGMVKTYDKKEGLKHDKIYCLTQDRTGLMWLGTEGGGIYKFDGKIFTNYLNKEGLSSESIYSIVCDNENNIWVGTSSGIDKFNQKNSVFTHYGKQDGFLGVEANINAVHKDRKGNLWFGTVNGVIKYNPDKDIPNTVEPLTYIRDLKVFLKKTPFPPDNKFNYKQNHLTFDFIGLSLTVPEKVRYQYKMDGFDIDWSPVTGRPDVTYSNLSPGEYTFLVRACSGDGIWNKYPVQYSFTITPPFWQTIWFYALSAVVLLGGFYAFVVVRTRNLEKAKIILEHQVEERTAEVVQQKEEIEKQNDELGQKNKDITDSIQYAKRIQEAILPPMELIYSTLSQSFVIYKPKDIVSGDFYWFSKKNDLVLMSVADCTGHGVPGAFMSILGNTALNEIVNEKDIYEPSEVLQSLDASVTTTLKQRKGEDKETRDGMDISFMSVNLKTGILNYSGANRPMFIIRNNEIAELKGDSFPIGGHYENQKIFTNKTRELQSGDTIYMFSDGVVDQFGGPKGKKFMTKNLKAILVSIQHLSMSEQEIYLRKTLSDWMGSMEQIDDILMIGIRF